MAAAHCWHHIHIHFARRHALRNVDEPHTVTFRMNHFPRVINVNEHDVIAVRNIRLRHLNNQEEIGVQLMDH